MMVYRCMNRTRVSDRTTVCVYLTNNKSAAFKARTPHQQKQTEREKRNVSTSSYL